MPEEDLAVLIAKDMERMKEAVDTAIDVPEKIYTLMLCIINMNVTILREHHQSAGPEEAKKRTIAYSRLLKAANEFIDKKSTYTDETIDEAVTRLLNELDETFEVFGPSFDSDRNKAMTMAKVEIDKIKKIMNSIRSTVENESELLMKQLKLIKGIGVEFEVKLFVGTIKINISALQCVEITDKTSAMAVERKEVVHRLFQLSNEFKTKRHTAETIEGDVTSALEEMSGVFTEFGPSWKTIGFYITRLVKKHMWGEDTNEVEKMENKQEKRKEDEEEKEEEEDEVDEDENGDEDDGEEEKMDKELHNDVLNELSLLLEQTTLKNADDTERRVMIVMGVLKHNIFAFIKAVKRDPESAVVAERRRAVLRLIDTSDAFEAKKHTAQSITGDVTAALNELSETFEVFGGSWIKCRDSIIPFMLDTVKDSEAEMKKENVDNLEKESELKESMNPVSGVIPAVASGNTVESNQSELVRLRLIEDRLEYEVHVRVKPGITLDELKKRYAEKIGVETSTFRFVFNGQIINDDDTPTSLGMKEDDTIKVIVESHTEAYESALAFANSEASSPPGFIKLRACDAHNVNEIHFRVKLRTTMGLLMKTYAVRVGVDISTLRFSFNGQVLNDVDTATSLEMEENDMIKVEDMAEIKRKLLQKEKKIMKKLEEKGRVIQERELIQSRMYNWFFRMRMTETETE